MSEEKKSLKEEMKKGDLVNPAYWVGHGIVIVATVVGVYLAASVGFQKAVDLELLRADRGTYYLANSLLMETKDNIDRFDQYAEKTKGTNVYHEHITGMRLNSFVYDSAKFSDSTFEMKPEVVSAVSQYYFKVDAAMQAYKAQQIGPSTLVDRVKKYNTEFSEGGHLQAFEDHVAELKAICEKKGLKL